MRVALALVTNSCSARINNITAKSAKEEYSPDFAIEVNVRCELKGL